MAAPLFKGITRRWAVNGLGALFALLLLFEVAFLIAVRNYYYQSVSQSLASTAERMAGSLETYLSQSNLTFEERARQIAENFNEKEQVEMQVVDTAGRILVSSSGFAVPVDASDASTMKDYQKALQTGTGTYRGKNQTGENIMAMTTLIQDESGMPVGAVRYLVSLTLIDRQILLLSMAAIIGGIVIMFFVILASSYFISSIVHPVTAIGQAARRMALGDYDHRIEKHYNDEIGDLCDTINYMAEEIGTADRLKKEFISSVSHELRTPLTAIKGWTETLQGEGTDAGTMQKGLEIISGEADRLSGIVEELLDFSRTQDGTLNLRLDRLDILKELQSAVFFMRDRAQKERVQLQYIESAPLPPVIGDRDRLRQVFINLLDNAIKYSRKGDKVRVEAADMGVTVQIVISDSGVGIAKDDLPRVKDKFYKANQSRPGSGIGLALADEIITRHQGTLTVDSRLGMGTTVTITLPAVCEPAVCEPGAKAAELEAVKEAPAQEKEKP